jgi:penicillin-binding protein 2
LKGMIDSLRTSGKSPELKSGALVAMDPRNGEVLALASYPDYNPSLFIPSVSEADWKKLSNEPSALFNRAISGAYPPGSTFKAIVTAAALEAGVIDPNDEFFCAPGVAANYYGMRCMSWEFGKSHGNVNLYEAIATSCNIYFYELGKRLTIDQLSGMAKKFGLGSKTGIELALIESAGKVLQSSDRKIMPGEKLSYTIGQMVTVTPLQLARLYGAIANRGALYEPRIIKGIVGPDGKILKSEEPVAEQMIQLKSSTWDALHKGMRMTVTEDEAVQRFPT